MSRLRTQFPLYGTIFLLLQGGGIWWHRSNECHNAGNQSDNDETNGRRSSRIWPKEMVLSLTQSEQKPSDKRSKNIFVFIFPSKREQKKSNNNERHKNVIAWYTNYYVLYLKFVQISKLQSSNLKFQTPTLDPIKKIP